jgi:hypothetical protein
MSIENKDLVALLDERIRRISKEVADEVLGKAPQPSDLFIKDWKQ